ncbi:response regulator transcription factor [Microvirga terrestris]|uniref:Response regulator n=1 Tax=Microvirga terrestris TaxID=2791024 RepID=A0ABS0HUX6_9HYPH|nr:response regulator [Microvirga terrestris]MBF9197273.1 response regulator [Microvirga terrestris]
MSMTPGLVIVVDDDDAVRQSLKFALEMEGLNVRLYESGDALLADKDLPVSGCLVIDYHMPAMDGVELIDRLRRRAVRMPSILITARATKDLHRRASRSGFREVLEKPFEDEALIDSILEALTIPA